MAEFQQVIAPLADPTAFGGSADDAFELVCPYLPGFAFCADPANIDWGVNRIAAAWPQLIAQLGYGRSGARCCDWSSAVTVALGGPDTAYCPGVRVMLAMASRVLKTEDKPPPEERRALRSIVNHRAWDNCREEQRPTRPQTLA